MAILKVLQYPDARLRLKAKPVEKFNAETNKIVQDMFDTLYGSENCAGYAAIQMNIQKQIVVIDFSEKKNEPLCFINPVILETRGKTNEPEACMSVPSFYAAVERAEWVRVQALDANGKSFEIETDGFLAKCIQHEIDHLNGILFIDYLSPLKRRMYEKKLSKMKETVQV